MATIEVKCPKCGSAKVIKHGKTEKATKDTIAKIKIVVWEAFDWNIAT